MPGGEGAPPRRVLRGNVFSIKYNNSFRRTTIYTHARARKLVPEIERQRRTLTYSTPRPYYITTTNHHRNRAGCDRRRYYTLYTVDVNFRTIKRRTTRINYRRRDGYDRGIYYYCTPSSVARFSPISIDDIYILPSKGFRPCT